MSMDADADMETESGSFVFSRPNMIPNPDKIFNSAPHSDNIFGGRANLQQDTSAFTFAKPAVIERLDHDGDFRRPNAPLISRTNRIRKPLVPSQVLSANQKRKETLALSPDTTGSSPQKSVFKSSPLTPTQVIKKTQAFTELEKNSRRKKSESGEVRLLLANSVTCIDVPDELLLRSEAKKYLDQFGEILKITVKPKRKMIVVYYSSKEAAKAAHQKAGKYKNLEFKVEWTSPELLNKPKKKETVKKTIASFLNLDDEVKEELKAMRELEYTLPSTRNALATSAAKARVKKASKVVANKEMPKKVLPLAAKPLKTIRQRIGASKLEKKPDGVMVDKPAAAKVERTLPLPKVDKLVVPKLNPVVSHPAIPKISSAAIEEMQNLIRQAGMTSEEKFKILDARDKLMRLKRSKQQNLAEAKVTKGTCTDMCPEKERYMREFQRQLSPYEQLDSSEYKINHPIAVKQYSRSSADQEEPMAHDLRPLKSLQMTMSYLLHEIADLCEQEDANLTEWYHFLWDRMRSVRKDITQQELCCASTVELVEQCARFHILSSERLCAEEASVFDPKINSENLTKCLQTLKYMYHDLREKGIECKNEPEFRAYVILLNLNNGTFISELSHLPPAIQHSESVKFALAIYSAIAMNNYVRFFKLVRSTTYLNGCILMRYFNQVRIKALKVMVKAYCRASGSTEYPLYELIDILGFEDEDEAFDFCNRTGLKCDRDSLYIKLNKETFHMPENNIEQGRAYNLVLSKRLQSGQSVGQCIAGGTWPERSYENHKPHCSFDERGFLFMASVNARDQNLTRDPYEFVDDEAGPATLANDDVIFVSETKPPAKATANNLKDKKPANAIASTAARKIPDHPFKPRTEPTSTPANNNIFASSNATALKTTNIFASTQPSSAPSSIFAKPASPAFTAIPTKASVLPTDSPFSAVVNKSIFSGNNQANLFKPASSSISSPNFFKRNVDAEVPRSSSSGTETTVKSSSMDTAVSSSSTEPQRKVASKATKRHLEDPMDSAEKKALTEKEELLRKRLELELKLRQEQERLRLIERVNKQALETYEELQSEVIKEDCAAIARAELDRLEKLSSELYEDVLAEMCETILREQLFIQDAIMEVESRLRERLIMKYYRVWKQWAARRRAQRREALDNTPVWLQPESLDDCARKLYRPEQSVAIKYAMACKKRNSWPLDDQEEKEETKGPKHTPIQYVVYVGLKENANTLDCEPRQHYFWKLVVSWPFLDNRLTLWRHKKLVSKYLSPADSTLEPIIIRHKPNPTESLDICIRYFEGLISENCIIGMDALLFIVSADEDLRSVERRLGKAVLSRNRFMPISLVVVVFGNDNKDSKKVDMTTIECLLQSGHVSEYSILYENSVDENVVLRIFQSATLWLAINRSPPVPLEMDYLQRIFNDCLTEELWLRIQSHLSHTPRLLKALKDPNFIINLHNEAITHMTDIILDPESMTYSDFAPELMIYLNNKRTYPCTYEYFDSVWKHPEYRAELERIMNSFIFPPWKDDWPISDAIDAYDAIVEYCRQMVSYDSSIPVTNNIMSDMYMITDESEDSYSSFIDVLLHIMAKKISDLGGNTRVVYNKNHIKHFQTLPWWFRSSTLMDYVAQHEDDEENEYSFSQLESRQNASTPEPEMEFEDFECDIDELNETCKQQDEEQPIEEICYETRSHVAEIENTAEKFEKELAEQQLRNKNFEKELLKALEDGNVDITI